MKILVAVDGSRASDQALEIVLERQWGPGNYVRLLHVVAASGIAPFDTPESASQALSGLAANCLAIFPRMQFDSQVYEGPVADTLLKAADGWRADLIVVGTNDRLGLDRLLLGSVSQSVLERASCPVLVARKPDLPPASGPGNVLVALDDSPYSAAAVEWVMEQSWAREKSVGLLSLVEPLPGSFSLGGISQASEALLAHQQDELIAEGMLEQWSEMLRQGLGIEQVPFGVAQGDAAEMIVAAARNWPAELVVLGSHGRSGLAKLVLGSVSQKVSAQAHCCVEVVRGRESAEYAVLRARVAGDSQLAKLLAEKRSPRRQAGGSGAGNSQHVFFPTMLQ